MTEGGSATTSGARKDLKLPMRVRPRTEARGGDTPSRAFTAFTAPLSVAITGVKLLLVLVVELLVMVVATGVILLLTMLLLTTPALLAVPAVPLMRVPLWLSSSCSELMLRLLPLLLLSQPRASTLPIPLLLLLLLWLLWLLWLLILLTLLLLLLLQLLLVQALLPLLMLLLLLPAGLLVCEFETSQLALADDSAAASRCAARAVAMAFIAATTAIQTSRSVRPARSFCLQGSSEGKEARSRGEGVRFTSLYPEDEQSRAFPRKQESNGGADGTGHIIPHHVRARRGGAYLAFTPVRTRFLFVRRHILLKLGRETHPALQRDDALS